MQRHDPPPWLCANEFANRVVENRCRTPGGRERRVIKNHRLLANGRRFGGRMLTHERIELGPARLAYCKELQFLRDRRECRRVTGARRAIQIEETTDVDVSRF